MSKKSKPQSWYYPTRYSHGYCIPTEIAVEKLFQHDRNTSNETWCAFKPIAIIKSHFDNYARCILFHFKMDNCEIIAKKHASISKYSEKTKLWKYPIVLKFSVAMNLDCNYSILSLDKNMQIHATKIELLQIDIYQQREPRNKAMDEMEPSNRPISLG